MDSAEFNRPIIGFRVWHWEPGFLESYSSEFCWKEPLPRAECLAFDFGDEPPSCNEAPGKSCHCGYNAWFDMESAINYGTENRSSLNLAPVASNVFGVIAGSGRVEMHSKGFRSERAQILAFYSPDRRLDAITKAAAKEHGKPWFTDLGELMTWVSEYGVLAEHLKLFPDLSDTNACREYRESWRGVVWPLDSVDDECSFEDEREGKHWFQNGQLHRDGDKPAVERPNGSKEWYQRGLLHRDGDQPALIDEFGTRFYYELGVPHRIGGPAIESDIEEQWIENGELHRIDGPAVVYKGLCEGLACEYWYRSQYLTSLEGPESVLSLIELIDKIDLSHISYLNKKKMLKECEAASSSVLS